MEVRKEVISKYYSYCNNTTIVSYTSLKVIALKPICVFFGT